ncbi:MAG: hypothetical protein WC391_05485 [Methanoregula sp.]|jgi:multisubunit Na+/H+ antiporter MnhG subunit
MSSLVLDIVLYVLIIVSAGFAGTSVIGLLLFPDIRSRQFTGTRASMLSFGAITLAGLSFGLYAFSIGGGTQYLDLIIVLIVLLALLVILNTVAARVIRSKITKGPDLPVNELTGDEKST